MAKNKGLGKGLSVLLGGDVSTEEENEGIKLVSLSRLEPSPYQPRRVFNEDAINDLVDSIKTKGVIQPLIVRLKDEEKEVYEIIGGERRWRASQTAGLTEVPVLIKNFSDKEALEVALIENLQRQDLNALEEAEGYRRLMDEFSNTQEELAKSVGKSRSHIANTIRLLGLPEKVKGFLETGKLSSGHARALLTAKEPEMLAQTIISKGLNVRQTEKLAQEGVVKKKAKKKAIDLSEKQDECDILATDLSRILGMRVAIKPNKIKGGDLILSYETLEQLDTLITRLSSERVSHTKQKEEEIVSAQNIIDEDIIQMENEEIGEIIFDDSFSNQLEEDVISLDTMEEEII